jgi:hypothetical protein
MALLRWETNSRYYCAMIGQDLFGMVVNYCHGGKFNDRGRMRTIPVADIAEAKAKIYAIAQRRARRGYRLVA